MTPHFDKVEKDELIQFKDDLQKIIFLYDRTDRGKEISSVLQTVWKDIDTALAELPFVGSVHVPKGVHKEYVSTLCPPRKVVEEKPVLIKIKPLLIRKHKP